MKKLQRKYISTQAAVIAALVIAVVFSFLVFAQRIAVMHIEKDTQILLEITARDADTFSIFFSSKIDLTKNLCQSLSYTARNSWDSILQQLGEVDESSVFVIDASGNDVLSGENIGIAQETLDACLSSNGNGLIGPGYDPITGKRSTFAYSTFEADDGEPLYVLTAIDNEDLYNTISLSVYGGEGYSYIVDSEGYTVLYSKQPDSNKTFSGVLELLSERETSYMHSVSKISDLENALKKGVAGVGYFRHDGKDCVVSAAPIQISGGWNVITVVDENYLYSEIRKMLMYTVQVLFVIIACFTVSVVMILNNSRRSKKYQLLSEQLQEAKSEAEQANRAKSEFLSRMSHDIRTPMNTIINLTRMVKEEIDDKDAAISDLNKVETSNTFLLALINDILDMSRIEQGKIELHPENYSYFEFVNYISSTFEPICKAKNIRFILQQNTENIEVYVDKVRLNQICFNLLSNAVKYTPEGGTVRFEFDHGEIQNGSMSSSFRISDTGIGISEKFQMRMFEPFEREADSLAAGQGSGLGLSIVKEIVALMGGTMVVESKPDVGTTFCVKLELKAANEEIKPADENHNYLDVLQGRNVLLAEDHPLNQQIAQRLLRKMGVSVVVADNGQAAVDLFARNGTDYDAVLMDMRMPVMDGLSASRAIRKLPGKWAREVPIIAMTANAFQEDKEAAAAAGMNAHLAKPVDPRLLYQTLANQIAARRR